MNNKQEILVVVHPGSACGSGNANIGKHEARSYRESMTSDLNEWNAGVIVIDGFLSDELPDYPEFDRAIKDALSNARRRKFISRRANGCDNSDKNADDRIREIVTKMGDAAKECTFTVTGAWYHNPKEQTGCVNGVLNVLEEMGCTAWLADSAMRMPSPFDDDNDDEAVDDSHTTSRATQQG